MLQVLIFNMVFISIQYEPMENIVTLLHIYSVISSFGTEVEFF